MKTCSMCQILQKNNNFYKDTTSKDGLCSRCKTCLKKVQKRRTKKHFTPEELEWFRMMTYFKPGSLAGTIR